MLVQEKRKRGRPRKVKHTMEAIIFPESITSEEIGDVMYRLNRNGDFKILYRRWLQLRSDILEKGKEEPDAKFLWMLKGFDLAVEETQKYLQERKSRKQYEDSPTQDLEG